MIFTPNQISEFVVKTITGRVQKNPTRLVNIAKTPNFDLTDYDLAFPMEMVHWQGYVELNTPFLQSLTNILEYCMIKLLGWSQLDANNAVYLQELKRYMLRICRLEGKEDMASFLNSVNFFVCENLVYIKYQREVHAVDAIKAVYKQGRNFGKKQDCYLKVKLEVEYADESEVTNLRLDLLKKVSANLLKLQGIDVQDEVCDHNYIFTIKSEGKTIDKHKRYICGAVLNSNKKKEKDLTVESYMQNKIAKVKDLCDQRHPNVCCAGINNEEHIKRIVDASVSHELLSIKHISTVMLESSDNIDQCVKEGSYVLYNNVRMTAILERYAQQLLKGDIPQIPEVEHLYAFSTLDVEEWNLFYNYIFKYPDVLNSTVSFEPKFDVNIHLLWSFVSSLCHDFSRYYEKNRFLLPNPNYDSRISELSSERLHLLRSLRIILRNALALLEVKEVEYM